MKNIPIFPEYTCFPDSTQHQQCGMTMLCIVISRLCPQLIGTSADLCEEIKIHTERTNYIKLHVCELDYILVIFCMNCLFHRIHVCQLTWRGKRNNLRWPLVVKYAVLLTGVMFERKQSIFIVSMLFRTDISHGTRVNLMYELPMHHAIYRNCTSF